MKYIVYLTLNKVNGKIYVGVHKTDTPFKFDGYFGCGIKSPKGHSNPSTAFQLAFKKYGAKNFTRHTLAVFDDEAEAYDMEATIVTMEFVKSHKTYNVAIGGGSGAGTHSCKPVFCYSITGEFVKEFPSKKEAATFAGLSSTKAINYCLENKSKTAGGYQWSDVKSDKFISKVKSNTTVVHKYSLDGTYIDTYRSLKDAAKSVNKENTTPISNCLTGNRKKAYNHIWRYEYAPWGVKVKVPASYKKVVYRYTMDGIYIDKFASSCEAASYLGKSIKSNITSCANGNRKSAGGFKWSFEYKNKIEI